MHERFTHYQLLINEYLNHSLPAENADPEPIYRAMRYSLFAGGKRLRPVLCMAVAESIDRSAQDVLPVAAAIEMIHTYSLIHDDLPCMDDDDFRRGKPTNHKVFGEAMAVLAGDALLTFAFDILSRASYSAEVRCRLIAELAHAAGTAGMIGGQVIDMLSENKQLSRLDLEKLHGMKTAALIGYSAIAPSIVLERSESQQRALAAFGEAVGLAFQIVDDILDIEGETEILGKTAGKDSKTNKATFPLLLGLDESKQLAESLAEIAKQSIAAYDRHGYLVEFAEYILRRNR